MRIVKIQRNDFVHCKDSDDFCTVDALKVNYRLNNIRYKFFIRSNLILKEIKSKFMFNAMSNFRISNLLPSAILTWKKLFFQTSLKINPSNFSYIFLLDINFENLIIRLYVLIISLILAKISKRSKINNYVINKTKMFKFQVFIII